MGNNKHENHKIYLLKAGNNYKIGITMSLVKDRVKSLQTGNPVCIEIIHSVDSMKRKQAEYYEKELHFHFNQKKQYGEWFKLTKKEVISAISIMDFVKNSNCITEKEIITKEKIVMDTESEYWVDVYKNWLNQSEDAIVEFKSLLDYHKPNWRSLSGEVIDKCREIVRQHGGCDCYIMARQLDKYDSRK